MDQTSIVLRVLFEYCTYDQGAKLAQAIEGAVIRHDIQEAGGMPNLADDLSELRQLIVDRYATATEERRNT